MTIHTISSDGSPGKEQDDLLSFKLTHRGV